MQIYFGLHGQETVSELSALDPRESGLNLTELFLDYYTLPKGAFPQLSVLEVSLWESSRPTVIEFPC